MCTMCMHTNILVDLSHLITDLVLLIHWKHVWDLPGVEQVADVLQKALFLHLHVCEEEHGMAATLCTLPQDLLQVLPPFHRGVAFPNLHLEKFIVGHVGSQAGEGLSPRASHTNKESMAARLLQDSAYSDHVFNGKPEAVQGPGNGKII